MPLKCQFEEDAFQQLVDVAISRLTHIVTTPGRVTENVLGYDAAFFLLPSEMGQVLGAHVAPHVAIAPPAHPLNVGIAVDPAIWNGLSTIPPAKLPPFKLNLFVQYKSPEKLLGGNAAQWPHWGGPYFRYAMTRHQLDVMNRIDKAGPGALGCYCSPDFVDTKTLWGCTENGTILDRAHFVRAQHLANHGRYTYQSAKGQGKGFSEPEDIAPEDFESMLAQALATGSDLSLEQGILAAAKTILSATEGSSGRGPLGALLRQKRSSKTADPSGDDGQAAVWEAIRVIRAFEMQYRTKVFLVG